MTNVAIVVSPADAERFVGEARHAAVIDVDADHYSILITPPVISAVEQFVGTDGHQRVFSPVLRGQGPVTA